MLLHRSWAGAPIQEWKADLIAEAKAKHGDIQPLPKKTSLMDCITFDCHRDKMYIRIWFLYENSDSTGTHQKEIKVTEKACA